MHIWLVMFGPGNQLAELDAYSANDSASQAAFLTGATRKYGAKAGKHLGKPWETGSKSDVEHGFQDISGPTDPSQKSIES